MKTAQLTQPTATVLATLAGGIGDRSNILYTELQDTIRMSARNFDKALAQLESLGLIELERLDDGIIIGVTITDDGYRAFDSLGMDPLTLVALHGSTWRVTF